MLNHAARFFPILVELRRQLATDATLLEVGSGSLGLGEFWSGSFVGCDLSFPSRPVSHMRPVLCSGHQLPFGDAAFDGVVVSDVMEHVPPVLRKQVVCEVLRVAKSVVVFGYPSGQPAFALDQKLYRTYQSRNLSPPTWLQEHMLHPFPDESLLAELPEGWAKKIISNETLRFHYWMMRMEMLRPWERSFRLALRIMPRVVERLLMRENHEPSYRKIFVLTRASREAYA